MKIGSLIWTVQHKVREFQKVDLAISSSVEMLDNEGKVLFVDWNLE